MAEQREKRTSIQPTKMNAISKSKSARNVMGEQSNRRYQRVSVDDFMPGARTKSIKATQRMRESPKTTIRNGRHVHQTSSVPYDEERQTAIPALTRCKSNEERGQTSITMSNPVIHNNGIEAHTITLSSMSSANNNNRRQPRILCLSPNISDVQTAGTVVGWQVKLVHSDQEAVEAIHSRAYEALVVGLGTLSETPYCSPLVGYGHAAAPSMYRIVYTPQQEQNLTKQLVHSCFSSGADAVACSLQSLVSAICGLHQFQSVIPAGTKIAAHQRAIYSAYAPLRHLQQRQDQLICIAQGHATMRVQELEHFSQKLERQLRRVPPAFIQTVSGRSYHPSNSNKKSSIRLVHVSDTNNHHGHLHIPPGDLFVHTGNFTNPNESKANALLVFQDYLTWLERTIIPRFELVVFIAGNHDDILDQVHHVSLKEHLEARRILQVFLKQHATVRYLENSFTIFHDLVIYGTPTVYCQSSASEREDDDPQIPHAFEVVLEEDTKRLRNLDGVDIFLSNRAPSILSSIKDYKLSMDHVYSDENIKHAPTVHAFGHNNHNFGIGSYRGTVMMNGSQELLHSLDTCGGGTPLVLDVPIQSEEKRNQAKCGPRLLFHHHGAHQQSSSHTTLEC